MVSLLEPCRCLSSFGSMVWLTFGFTLRLELARCLTMHAMSPHSLLTSRWLWRELDPPRSRQTWTSSENTTSSSMRTSFTLLPRTPSQSMVIVLFCFVLFFLKLRVISIILLMQEYWEKTCWEEGSRELWWTGSWCGHKDSKSHPQKKGTVVADMNTKCKQNSKQETNQKSWYQDYNK